MERSYLKIKETSDSMEGVALFERRKFTHKLDVESRDLLMKNKV